jgi:hypothetical protein
MNRGRPSKETAYQKHLNDASVQLLGDTKPKSINSSNRKPSGRPKKEDIDENSPNAGSYIGNITKNNIKKSQANDYEVDYSNLIHKEDDWDGVKKLDLEYDYGKNQPKIDPKKDLQWEKEHNKDPLGFGKSNLSTESTQKDPLGLGLSDLINNKEDLDPKIFLSKSEAENSLDLKKLNELKYILQDILAGDPKAINKPEFQFLGLDNIKLAIEWIMNNDGFSSTAMQNLSEEPWRLVYRSKPPTMKEMLTEKYIGPQAETLFPWVKDILLEYFDPLKPYRTIALYYFIGGGKSTCSIIANLYVSICNSLMWHQYKFYGHAQPLDSYLSTPEGPKQMGDFKVGDIVSTPQGQSEVSEIHPQGMCEVYEVELEDGSKMECNIHHIFKVTWQKDKNNNDIWENVELQEILQHPERDYYIPELDN